MMFKSIVKDLTIFCILSLSFNVFANTVIESKFVSDTNIESYLEGSALSIKVNNNDYLYDVEDTERNSGLFDGMKYFKTELQKQRIEAFPDFTWVPIVGDIIFFLKVPVLDSKFIASPFLERGLIKKQLIKSLGNSSISGYGSADNLIQQLYLNGLNLALEKELIYGQSLSEYFLSNIPYDVIWPERRNISGESVIVPIVYLSNSTIRNEKTSGNTLAFGSADLTYASFEIDTASVVGQRDAVITLSKTFENTKGTVKLGGDLTISAGQSIANYSGVMSANDVSLVSEKIESSTLVTRYDFGFGYSVTSENIGVISALGDISLDATGNVVLQGSQISADGDLSVKAGNNIQIITQVEEYERDESGGFWSDSEQSTRNIRSYLSGANIALLASNQIVVQGAVIESPGNIQLLAGMGIYISNVNDKNSYNQTFKASSGGLFGSSESREEKAYTSKVVETLITADKNLMLETFMGDVILRGVDFNSNDILQVDAGGEIKMLLAKDTSYYSLESKSDDALYFRESNKGHYIETGIYNQLSTQGVISLNATHGVLVEYVDQGDNCNSVTCIERVVNNLSKYPEFEWISKVYHENPNNVDWQALSYNLEKWNVHNSGLTEAGQIFVTIVATIAAPGASSFTGLLVEGAALTAQQVVQNSMIKAGMASLLSKASISGINNDWNISVMADDVLNDEAFTEIAQAMLTAAITKGFDQSVGVSDSDYSFADTSLDTALDQSWVYLQSALVSGATTFAFKNPEGTSDTGFFLTNFSVSLAGNIAFNLHDYYQSTLVATNTSYNSDYFFINTENLKSLGLDIEYLAVNYGKYLASAYLVDSVLHTSPPILDPYFAADYSTIPEYETATAYADVAKNHFFDQDGKPLLTGDLSNSQLSQKAEEVYANLKAHNVDILKASSSLAFYSSITSHDVSNENTPSSLSGIELWLRLMSVLVSYENSLPIYKEEAWSIELGNALKNNNMVLVNQLLIDKATEIEVKTGLSVGLSDTTEAIKAIAYIFKDYYQGVGDASKDLFEYAEKYKNGNHTYMEVSSNVGVVDVPSIDSYFTF
ncbi:hypothetical protein TW85_06620 [Marinomonas sp. S3726]|uniref:hemagglutinin repeat-containing protein n=1 Tax=Marinomonas sp. S3726 TaxID=579484 RepID=UPI0005FA76A3|nr:hemagglutinin repeat-containing protein [Marinomonas sp. S3726]KJZ15249.1 hypothetical protein TW85_06620 [Marinomonas sp. S3726]